MDILISFQETKILNADIGKRNKQPRGCEQHPIFLLQIPPPKRPAFFVFYILSVAACARPDLWWTHGSEVDTNTRDCFRGSESGADSNTVLLGIGPTNW